MAISPMLIVGCGGSGGKVVLGLRRRLEQELERRGWNDGIPRGWQLMWIDVPETQEGYQDFGDPLSRNNYIGLANVDEYRLVDGALMSVAQAANLGRLAGWRPSPYLKLPVKLGAGQLRAVGRAVALANSKLMSDGLMSGLNALAGEQAELAQLSSLLGGDGSVLADPAVVVVSSMAGGTGAGIFMDVCDIVRGKRPDLSNRIMAMLFTAEIFKEYGEGGMSSNTVAAMSEIAHGLIAQDHLVEPLYGTMAAGAAAGMSGPSFPFVIGMQPLGGGKALGSPDEAYRAVTETLVATIVNERFTQDFFAYQVTNFSPYSDAKHRRTAFEMLNHEDNGVPPRCGLLSSFGSASVAVGAGRFSEYARDRLSRAVLDHIAWGWRAHGRQLMGEKAGAATSDPDVITFLVERDRSAFIDACGLWEEDEPNGTEHNQVLEGIVALSELTAIAEKFRVGLLGELGRQQETTAATWVSNIVALVNTRRTVFLGDVDKALTIGRDAFCSGLVGRVSAAVSQWLAEFGLPVTTGLVEALRDQCKVAEQQLRAQATGHGQRSGQDVHAFVTAAFQKLAAGKARHDSEYVKAGLAQALGPVKFEAVRRRADVAVEVLEFVRQRVLQPLLTQLADVGSVLAEDEFQKQVESWPDAGGGVTALYSPAPSEYVLVPPAEWDGKYKTLLSESAGSVTAARDLVAAGGFAFGPVTNRKKAEAMVTFSADRWWEPNDRYVEVLVHLKPDEVRLRARQWANDESHSLGKFAKVSLYGFLTEEGAQRQERAKRFEQLLSKAVDRAQPLVRIDTSLMQRMHTSNPSIPCVFACEAFPFPPSQPELRGIVDRVMAKAGASKGEGKDWCKEGETGEERVLMVSFIKNAVQPAVITSLTEPIVAAYDRVTAASLRERKNAMQGFWSNNRARLLTETIPLTDGALRNVMAGWFLGRLLGVVTDPAEDTPFTVKYMRDASAATARLPWPLLRHRDQADLHLRSRGLEWLPAILEHLGLAMMLFGHQPEILDGYEQLYRLGASNSAAMERWIERGETPISGGAPAQLTGTMPTERKESLMTQISAMRDGYMKKLNSTTLSSDWEDFQAIPFGYELFPAFAEVLVDLHTVANGIETEAHVV